MNALLYPYAKSIGVYKCPGNQLNMLRGVSMNERMDGSTNGTYKKITSVPHPTDHFVLIDEYQVSINDGWFEVSTKAGFMNDWPAEYHNSSSGMSFADGHAELHNWKFLGLPPAGYNPGTGMTADVRDVAVLQNYSYGP